MSAPKRPTGFRLPPDVAEWLRVEAERRAISQNALVIEALREKRDRAGAPRVVAPPPPADDDVLDF